MVLYVAMSSILENISLFVLLGEILCPVYTLDQDRVLSLLSQVWGDASPHTEMHHNNKIQLHGDIISLPENHESYQRLAEECTRKHLYDPEYSFKQKFQNMPFYFNNKKIMLEFLIDVWDIDGIHNIDHNDTPRIKIYRGCEYNNFDFCYCNNKLY